MDQTLRSLKLEIVNKVLQCEQLAILETVKRLLDLDQVTMKEQMMAKRFDQSEDLQQSIDEVFSGINTTDQK